MLELTAEQQQAMETQTTSPLRLVNPKTQEVFVLIRQDIYEQVRLTLKPFNRGWDDPELDVYEEHRKKS